MTQHFWLVLHLNGKFEPFLQITFLAKRVKIYIQGRIDSKISKPNVYDLSQPSFCFLLLFVRDFYFLNPELSRWVVV